MSYSRLFFEPRMKVPALFFVAWSNFVLYDFWFIGGYMKFSISLETDAVMYLVIGAMVVTFMLRYL